MHAASGRVAAAGRRDAGRRRALARGAVQALLILALTAGAGQAGAVSLQVDEADHGGYRVEGRFVAAASAGAAWRVLTDYGGLPKFVTSMAKSAADTSDGLLLVEQEAVVRYLFFSRRMRVVLDVREDSLRKIRFADTAGEDFVHYDGAWSLVPRAEGVEVVYQLDARPRTAFPRFLQRRMLNRTVVELLTQVRDEIERAEAR